VTLPTICAKQGSTMSFFMVDMKLSNANCWPGIPKRSTKIGKGWKDFCTFNLLREGFEATFEVYHVFQ